MSSLLGCTIKHDCLQKLMSMLCNCTNWLAVPTVPDLCLHAHQGGCDGISREQGKLPLSNHGEQLRTQDFETISVERILTELQADTPDVKCIASFSCWKIEAGL